LSLDRHTCADLAFHRFLTPFLARLWPFLADLTPLLGDQYPPTFIVLNFLL
jgi:hypothetical protein